MKRSFFVGVAGAALAAAAAFIGCGSDGSSSTGQGGGDPSATSGPTSTGQGGGAGQGGDTSTGQGGDTSTGQGGASTGQGGGNAGLWEPTPGTSWQWQLSNPPIDTSFNVAMYDIDLFETKQSEIDKLHADGRIVICYFSAGSYEDYRPDKDQFPASVKGSPLDPPFQDELWLDTRAKAVRDIMKTRLDLAKSKKCDGVEPDNVDGFDNDNGFNLTEADQLDYNKFIAAEAHARGLSVGLKNDIAQLADLVADFDWALNEECYTYNECDEYTGTFIAAKKAVFHAEYVDASELSAVCGVTKPIGLSTLIKKIELDAYQVPCP